MPESQESVESTVSSTFSAPALASTSSNLSSDQDVASPSKSNGQAEYSRSAQKPMLASPSRAYSHVAIVDAPRIDATAANALQLDHTTATPMSQTSPTATGLKRSADGSVKGAGSSTSPTQRTFAHKRNKSMDTHSSTRIGEVRENRPTYDPNVANPIRSYPPSSRLVSHMQWSRCRTAGRNSPLRSWKKSTRRRDRLTLHLVVLESHLTLRQPQTIVEDRAPPPTTLTT